MTLTKRVTGLMLTLYYKYAKNKPNLISDLSMIIFVFFLPNASSLVFAKKLRKWAEKAFAPSTLVFHDLVKDSKSQVHKEEKKKRCPRKKFPYGVKNGVTNPRIFRGGVKLLQPPGGADPPFKYTYVLMPLYHLYTISSVCGDWAVIYYVCIVVYNRPNLGSVWWFVPTSLSLC
jgi:hypothetical protein